MILEQTTDHTYHVLDGGIFLGVIIGPEYTNKSAWLFEPSERQLNAYQLGELQHLLKTFNGD